MLRRTITASLLVALFLAACGSEDDTTGDTTTDVGAARDRPVVAVANFPIETVVLAVGGDAIEIVTLTPPGEEAHDYEPSAAQVTALDNADAVFFFGRDFQPGVQEAVEQLAERVRTVDLLDELTILPVTDQLAGVEGEVEGETLTDGGDPHVWLDPTNMAAMADAVAEVLGELDPDGAASFSAGAARFSADMDSLDSEMAERLTDCATDVVVTTHRAFEYLTRRYGLTQLPIAGISPGEEPSAKTLEAVAAAAEANGVTTIFFEENLPDDLARTVADEIGADTAVLDPLESLSQERLDAGETYRSVMLANADALAEGLGCS